MGGDAGPRVGLGRAGGRGVQPPGPGDIRRGDPHLAAEDLGAGAAAPGRADHAAAEPAHSRGPPRRHGCTARSAGRGAAPARVAERVAGHRRLREGMSALLDRGEQLAREAIASLPDGAYPGHCVPREPRGGRALDIWSEITVEGDRLAVALRGSPQIDRYFNSYFGNSISAIYAGLLTVFPKDIPTQRGRVPLRRHRPRPEGLDRERRRAHSLVDGHLDSLRQHHGGGRGGTRSKAAPERAVAGWSHFCGSTFAGCRLAHRRTLLAPVHDVGDRRGGSDVAHRRLVVLQPAVHLRGHAHRQRGGDRVPHPDAHQPLRAGVPTPKDPASGEAASGWRWRWNPWSQGTVISFIGEGLDDPGSTGTSSCPTAYERRPGGVLPLDQGPATPPGRCRPIVPHSVVDLDPGTSVLVSDQSRRRRDRRSRG